ncbi:hypothetical protein FRB95_009415 [Tulasnella sp. JGI-2019a]|nr:hypothetical protein FRB95_009415 [Tulasnella sp. JGI-2019a]
MPNFTVLNERGMLPFQGDLHPVWYVRFSDTFNSPHAIASYICVNQKGEGVSGMSNKGDCAINGTGGAVEQIIAHPFWHPE